jgi:stage III sporulation protein AB
MELVMGKLLGVTLVISASTVAGFVLADRFKERCRLLTIWLRILEIMQIEIFHHTERLPEVFRKVAAYIDDHTIATAFNHLATDLEFGSGQELITCWETLISATGINQRFRNDYLVLKEWGTHLGSTDRSDQLEKIELYKARLENNLKLAEIEKNKQVGLYRYSGFAIGVVLVLWLL